MTRGSSSIAQWLFVPCPQRTFLGMPCGLLSEALSQTISGNIQIRTSADRLCRSLRCRSVGKPSYDPDISQCRPADELPRWLVKLMKYVRSTGRSRAAAQHLAPADPRSVAPA